MSHPIYDVLRKNGVSEAEFESTIDKMVRSAPPQCEDARLNKAYAAAPYYFLEPASIEGLGTLRLSEDFDGDMYELEEPPLQAIRAFPLIEYVSEAKEIQGVQINVSSSTLQSSIFRRPPLGDCLIHGAVCIYPSCVSLAVIEFSAFRKYCAEVSKVSYSYLCENFGAQEKLAKALGYESLRELHSASLKLSKYTGDLCGTLLQNADAIYSYIHYSKS